MFKKVKHIGVGIGGINCPCCNDGLNKRKRNRQLRARLKEITRKEIIQSLG